MKQKKEEDESGFLYPLKNMPPMPIPLKFYHLPTAPQALINAWAFWGRIPTIALKYLTDEISMQIQKVLPRAKGMSPPPLWTK